MSTQPEEKKEIVEPTIALYIHLFTDKEKGIILTVKGNLNSKVIRILDLKQYMSLQFKQSISNVKYTPLELYKSLYSKPLKDTDKIRTYFDDGEDIYLQVLTEAIPVETTKTEKKDVVLSYKTLNNYSFYIASSTIVRVIVPVPGIEKVPKENIISNFTETSVEVKVNGAENGHNYRFAVPMLDAKIIPEKSEAFAKGKDLILRLRKANNEDHWSYLFKQKYVGEK